MQKSTDCVFVVGVPTDDCFVDLLLGDSALLLYCSESGTSRQNFTAVPTLKDLSSFMLVFTIVYVFKFFY